MRQIINMLLVLPLLFLLPSFCSASAMYSISEEQLTTLENHLNCLEANNEKLERLLKESGEDLSLALKALSVSKADLQVLQKELEKAREDSIQAKQSLKIANDELQNAVASVRKSEAVRQRTERQRNFWEVIAMIAAGFAVAR